MTMVEVLMVEDNPGDVVLVQEAINKVGLPYHVNVVRDGMAATEYLWGQGGRADAIRPDVIVLDLKLPRKNGREVLAEILRDSVLSEILVVLLSSSKSELELARALNLPARSYMLKPNTFAGYVALVKTIEAFRQEACKKREARQ